MPVVMHHTNIAGVSTIQMNMPHNLNSSENTKAIEMMYHEVLKRFEKGEKLPLLDPKEDMEIESDDLDKLLKARRKVDREIQKIEQSG